MRGGRVGMEGVVVRGGVGRRKWGWADRRWMGMAWIVVVRWGGVEGGELEGEGEEEMMIAEAEVSGGLGWRRFGGGRVGGTKVGGLLLLGSSSSSSALSEIVPSTPSRFFLKGSIGR